MFLGKFKSHTESVDCLWQPLTATCVCEYMRGLVTIPPPLPPSPTMPAWVFPVRRFSPSHHQLLIGRSSWPERDQVLSVSQ